MQIDPTLLDANDTSLGAGDMVVTRVFDLNYVNPASAMNLLDGMKLSVAASPIEETGTLIVTCYAHRMERIQRLLEMVDRPGRPREFRYRQLKYTMADTLTKKVEVLVAQLQTIPVKIAPMEQKLSSSILAVSAPLGPSTSASRKITERESADTSERNIVYLDADGRTNHILMIGHAEQLAIVEDVVDALDVAQHDPRALKVYSVLNLGAADAKAKLEELDVIGKPRPATAPAPTLTVSKASSEKPTASEAIATAEMDEIQVTVLETTNSLLVNATPFQHARMARVIEYVDTAARQEAIPYEIYFLESQDPEHLAQVLQSILQETIKDKDAKVEKVVRRVSDGIVIVPDKNTFSLIVYAGRKNQEWISKLIKSLDKRRPQVLIDATLVEIRKNDEFNYDLNMVASIPDLTRTSGQTERFMADENTGVTDALAQSNRSQFIDLQVKSGKGIGFYGDKHIQVLLTAVQAKNYGRVLAKPKVLVNDNEKGNIKTADTTYVATTSSVPVTGGTTGTQNNMIETSLQYQSYEAGITLEITPHISEGDLLRLEVALSRSDFTNKSDKKPPDLTSSNVGTVVTVPDGSTIILGGNAQTQPKQRRQQGPDPGRSALDRGSLPQHRQQRRAEHAVHLRASRDHTPGRRPGEHGRGPQANLRGEPQGLRGARGGIPGLPDLAGSEGQIHDSSQSPRCPITTGRFLNHQVQQVCRRLFAIRTCVRNPWRSVTQFIHRSESISDGFTPSRQPA